MSIFFGVFVIDLKSVLHTSKVCKEGLTDLLPTGEKPICFFSTFNTFIIYDLFLFLFWSGCLAVLVWFMRKNWDILIEDNEIELEGETINN